MTDIKCTLRAACPTLPGRGGLVPFEDIARAILGDSYELSLVICGDALARRMYVEQRKRGDPEAAQRSASYASNVLSFPLSKNDGEIFLNIRKAQREAKLMGIPPRERIAHLFVHGCFHLKGLDHGDAMEAAEKRIMSRFDLKK